MVDIDLTSSKEAEKQRLSTRCNFSKMRIIEYPWIHLVMTNLIKKSQEAPVIEWQGRMTNFYFN